MVRLPVVSLTDSRAMRQIMERMDRDPKVRHRIFREVAQNVSLQRVLLSGLKGRTRRVFIAELAKVPQLRPLLLTIAGQRS
jgi:hypothetical protein